MASHTSVGLCLRDSLWSPGVTGSVKPRARTVVFFGFRADAGRVIADELLTTGQAAGLLGCSRQHVVDLCASGRLPFEVIGTHRRVRRSDVERFSGRSLTRDQERSWWLHQAVAGRLVADPDGVLGIARRRLGEMRSRHGGVVISSFDLWAKFIDDGPVRVLEALTSREPWAVELRQNSPFAGVLSSGSRQAVLDAFRKQWRRRQAAA